MVVLSVVLLSVIYRMRQKLEEAEKRCSDALAHPPKLCDDYSFLNDRGFWVHSQAEISEHSRKNDTISRELRPPFL